MPIVSLNATTMRVRCTCGTEQAIPVASLVLGRAATGHDFAPDAIPLPPCRQCGGTETLHRSWDELPSAHHGTHFDRHRRTVNRLAKHLGDAGQTHKSATAREHHRHTGHDPPDMHEHLEVEIEPVSPGRG